MKKTEKLVFPIIKDPMIPPALRSMDEINEWIEEDYRLFFNRRLYDKEKKLNSVNIPFKLK